MLHFGQTVSFGHEHLSLVIPHLAHFMEALQAGHSFIPHLQAFIVEQQPPNPRLKLKHRIANRIFFIVVTPWN